MSPTDTFLIRVSREFLEQIATRDNEGNRLRVNWPDEPSEYSNGVEPIWEPSITIDLADNPFKVPAA